MTTRYDQTGKRRLELLVFDIVRTDMALDMVDTDQRFFQRIGECLRFRYTDEQGTDEARTIGYRDGIVLPSARAR